MQLLLLLHLFTKLCIMLVIECVTSCALPPVAIHNRGGNRPPPVTSLPRHGLDSTFFFFFLYWIFNSIDILANIGCIKISNNFYFMFFFHTVHYNVVMLTFTWNLGCANNQMRFIISSVKPVLWLIVNLHHVLSDGTACNSLTSYAILHQLSQVIHRR